MNKKKLTLQFTQNQIEHIEWVLEAAAEQNYKFLLSGDQLKDYDYQSRRRALSIQKQLELGAVIFKKAVER